MNKYSFLKRQIMQCRQQRLFSSKIKMGNQTDQNQIKIKFIKKDNPFVASTQNYGGDYSGFTGNIEGGPTAQGAGGRKGSGSFVGYNQDDD